MRACTLAAVLALLASTAGAQQHTELSSTDALRVCADPADLPFSNDKGAGFENRIAALIAGDLKRPVAFVYFPQTVGFVKNTLRARACDLIMGAVAGNDLMDTTNAIYHTGYMVVARDGEAAPPASLADPYYRGKRIGLIAATPPTNILVHQGLMGQVQIYPLNVDTRQGVPAQAMLRDLQNGVVDVALLWGPIAGYAIGHEGAKLQAVFLAPEPGGQRLDYRIAMGVRAGEPEFRREINGALTRQRPAIAAVLKEYGVPELPEGAPAPVLAPVSAAATEATPSAPGGPGPGAPSEPAGPSAPGK